jgi:hypothetical protein
MLFLAQNGFKFQGESERFFLQWKKQKKKDRIGQFIKQKLQPNLRKLHNKLANPYHEVAMSEQIKQKIRDEATEKAEKDHRDDINHLWSNSSEELDHGNVAGQPEESVHDLVSKLMNRICEDDKCIQQDMELKRSRSRARTVTRTKLKLAMGASPSKSSRRVMP